MKKITIQNIKNVGFMEFELPFPGVHIITGQNGVGKTTLFTCISRICNSNAYRNGFPSSKHSNMLDVFSGKISYTVDGQTTTYQRRTTGEWRPDNKLKTLDSYGYPEIVNITTKDERVFSQQDIHPRRSDTPDEWLNDMLNEVFTTNRFSAMTRITTGDLRRGKKSAYGRRNTAYVIPLGDNKYYSEQNFSFGEIVMLNLLLDIKDTKDGSILLIDELELALHPSAQIRLITILGKIAKEKRLTIIISTHSSSIIKSQKNVILLEDCGNNIINVIYDCPPAKAIGAIGMREDTMPDIILLVEDQMAGCLLESMVRKVNCQKNEFNYLDIRLLEIGGYENVMNFYKEAVNYIFYDNIYVTAFMDLDVKTDVLSYPLYAKKEYYEYYMNNIKQLKFLPYTPEVLLIKVLSLYKPVIIRDLKELFFNQQIDFYFVETFNFNEYDCVFPDFSDKKEYNEYMKKRGQFRNKCKREAKRIVEELASQTNQSESIIYRRLYSIAVDEILDEGELYSLLMPTLKRK